MNKTEEVQEKLIPVLASVNTSSDLLLHVRNLATVTHHESFLRLLEEAQSDIDKARELLRKALVL